MNWTERINEKGGETDDDQTIDPHTSLILTRPSFLWWWYGCLTVKCIYVWMDICTALNAFMHVYMRQLILKKKQGEREKTNEIYANMQKTH